MNQKAFDRNIFTLSPNGLSASERKNALDIFGAHIEVSKEHLLGYQNCQNLDYVTELQRFFNFHINNVGDPFVQGNLKTNSKVIETAVLDYFAALWNAKTPHNLKDRESYWGYVLTMGSTEGNLYGLWNARDYLGGKRLVIDKPDFSLHLKYKMKYLEALPSKGNPNAYTPVAFFSQDTHYSIIKAMRTLQIPTFYQTGKKFYPGQNPLHPKGEWTEEYHEVPSINGKKGPGSVDVDKLVILVEFFASKGYPILICCNYGTTFKGAYDDVKEIGEKLEPIFKKYGLINRRVIYDEEGNSDIRNGYWIHVDGALGAAYMPFLEMAYKQKKTEACAPIFDFRLPWVNSIVMSGHKWIGAPWPCGIFMTKVKYQLFPPDNPEYIGSPDTTFAGSRNGLTALILWNFLANNSQEDLINRAIRDEKLAAYAEEQLKALQSKKPDLDLWIERTQLSLTVRFRKPNDRIVAKYSLSCETLMIDGKPRAYSHIYLMDSVTKELVDEFIKELGSPDAFS